MEILNKEIIEFITALGAVSSISDDKKAIKEVKNLIYDRADKILNLAYEKK